MKRLERWVLICCIAFVGLTFAQSHPFTVKDLVVVERLANPQFSPDGRWIVFTAAKADLDANRFRSDLMLVGSDGANLRRLTSHPENDSDPRWLPDSRQIVFLSSRTGTSQVWKIRIDGGEAEPVTNLPLDAGNLLVSPDGKQIAFSAEVFPDCATLEETKSRLDEIARRKPSGQVYDRLFVRHWNVWNDGRRSHLFVMPISGGKPVDVMAGMDADWPAKPFGGADQATFTPDSQSIVFSTRHAGTSEAWSTNFDLYVASMDGSVKPRCLTESNPAWDATPTFSPDGKILAYLAMSRPGYEADRFRILVRDWPNGNDRVVATDWDRSPSSIFWNSDSKEIIAIAEDTGRQLLFAINAKTSKVRTLIMEGWVQEASSSLNSIAYCRSTLRSPAELFCVRTDGSGIRNLTRINQPIFESTRMGQPEQFSFAGWNNETVYAWVIKPVDFDPQKRYPVSFWIHGGPQGSFGDSFHFRWNPQIHAGAGYAVIMVDFHGSTGYGQAFCDSIRGDWGGKPLEDLQKGFAAAAKRYPWMDFDRAAALGASFGGYMVNWIAGNWPEAFKCLVSHAGSLDEQLGYFDTEELWFPEWDHLGTPWENPKSYEKHNPINYVQNWRTPMLVIHGNRDYRIPDTQGLSTFTALQRRGIPSQLLYFPDEGHWITKPHNMIQWQQTVLDWLDQWLVKPYQ
jgi:dipeptidyl aminopeptidase/acylaminoacyl peptidase